MKIAFSDIRLAPEGILSKELISKTMEDVPVDGREATGDEQNSAVLTYWMIPEGSNLDNTERVEEAKGRPDELKRNKQEVLRNMQDSICDEQVTAAKMECSSVWII